MRGERREERGERREERGERGRGMATWSESSAKALSRIATKRFMMR